MTARAGPDSLRLERCAADDVAPVTSYADHTVFQTEPWLRFVAATQGAQPVYARVVQGGACVGRFTGLVTTRYGLRMLGSPLPGWTTSYMGFNLEPGVSRAAALPALPELAFQQLHCVHVEVMDRGVATPSGLDRHRLLNSFELDLRPDEQEILARMTSACRRCIRKARDQGVTVEQASDVAFVDDYYSQLLDVFAKQGRKPTYGRRRVAGLVDALLPSGQLLMLRARDGDGRCIATGVFPAANGTMYFWGGASLRQHQILRPNEALQWCAMRYWKERGITRYDMGGWGEYKRKYGGREISVPWLRQSRFRVLEPARLVAREITRVRQRSLHLADLA